MFDFFKTVFLGFLGIISSVPSYVGYFLNFKIKNTIICSSGDSRYIFDVKDIKTKTINKQFDDLSPDCIFSLVNIQQGFSTRGGSFDFEKIVAIEGHDENMCSVEAVIASPDPDKVVPVITLDDNKISINTEYDSKDIRGYVCYTIKVPRTALIDLVKTNLGRIAVSKIDNSIKKAESLLGSINIKIITGDITARSDNGSISIDHVIGEVYAKSSNGSITVKSISSNVLAFSGNGKVSVASVEGNAEAKSDQGSVSVDFIKGNVFASSGNGKVSVASVEGDAKAKSAQGSVTVKFITGNVVAFSGNGSVSIDSVDGDVDAQSNNGSINLKELAKNIYARTSLGSIHHILGKCQALSTLKAKTEMGSVKYLGKKVKNNFSVRGDGQFKAEFKTSMGSIMIKE